MPSLILFPDTALQASAAASFIPWFAPLFLLRPPSLAPEADAPLLAADLARQVSPSGGAEAAGGKAGELAGLLRQWEQWIREHAGSTDLAALKLGVKPPPPLETVRGLMKEIRDFGQVHQGQPAPPPEVTADLFLHLAHIRGQEAQEVDGMLDQVQEGQKKLSAIMGLAEEDATPADYEEAFHDRLPPVDYSMDDQKHLARRMAAWARLAAGLAGEASQAWLATHNLAALTQLMERHDAAYASQGRVFRSPAGAAMPGPGPSGLPPADSPLAQEAARLVLPDLSGLDQEGLAQLSQKLMEQDGGQGLAALRQGLEALLTQLARGKWGSELKEKAAAQAKELAESAARLAAQAGLETEGRGVSILVFPGMGRAELLALMRAGEGGGQPQPEPKGWPEDWPAGSCPVVAAW
ncbi:hypothetical protein AAU61_11515 [Desulfocarbo indianensis]|nr:hypothetical protein AAU61_11515 [Desulfocarbo indianensis]